MQITVMLAGIPPAWRIYRVGIGDRQDGPTVLPTVEQSSSQPHRCSQLFACQRGTLRRYLGMCWRYFQGTSDDTLCMQSIFREHFPSEYPSPSNYIPEGCQ
ncbi:hypothetical protein ANTRET_LOCUS9398 [Anthophora retusa]